MPIALTFGSLALVALWEIFLPRGRRRFPALRRRIGNTIFWIFNVTAGALIFTQPDALRPPWSLPGWLSFVAGFLLLDFAVYLVHRCQHAVPFLWRFHALHHSDPDLDWSTSVRLHPADYLLLDAGYWSTTLLFGIPGVVVAVHSLSAFVMAAATHGNVRWPAWLERLLQPVIITLDQHLVHHSIDAAHLNTNFGTVLNIWDRLFGTLTNLPREAIPALAFGVHDLDARDACHPMQMLLTPLRIGEMYSSTYPMPDGREIEVSAERRGKTLRLRSRLVKDGRVELTHRRDYRHDPDMTVRAVASFTGEFEEITGLEALRLFPDDLLGGFTK